MYMYYRFMYVANVWNSADNRQVSANYQSMIYKPRKNAHKQKVWEKELMAFVNSQILLPAG